MIDPTLPELIRRAIQSRVADIHVTIPGQVVSYDAAKQTAVVQPIVRTVIEDDEDQLWEEDPKPITNVPVEWPGGGGMYLHFPLAAGDTGLLVFCERSIAEWRATGKLSTPADLRIHGINAATFRPGLRSNKSPRADAPADGEGVIAVGANILRVGPSSGAQFVALSEKVTSQFQTLKDAITNAVPVPQDGGVALQQTILAALTTWPGDVAATKLKAK